MNTGTRGRTMLSLALFTGLLALPAATQGAELPFSSRITVSTEVDFGFSVTVADLDGDGDVDALSASRNDNKIAWYDNTDGLGTFGPQQVIDSTGSVAEWISTADVDGDGDTDAIGAWFGSDTVSWYENVNGDASLWSRHDVTATGGPACVEAADVDRDGDLDLIVCLRSTGRVVVYFASTPGTFMTPGTFATPDLTTVTSARTADIDHDGDLDIVAAVEDPTGELRWYDNTNGDGTTWTERTIDPAYSGPGFVRTADVDTDGDIDVIVSSEGDDEIVWHDNSGDGSSWTRRQIATVSSPQGLFVRDVDQDGDPDVVSTSNGGNRLAWHENADGTGLSWNEYVVGSLTDAIRTTATDLDRDGDVDLIAISATTPASVTEGVVWHRNEWMHRTVEFCRLVDVDAANDGARSTFSADLDADGDLDILSASFTSGRIAWHENLDGDGLTWMLHDIDTGVASATRITAADVDHDGDLDAIAGDNGPLGINWYENTDGAGTFGPRTNITTAVGQVRALQTADIDGDGNLDLVSASRNDNKIAWYANPQGDGTFGIQTVIDAAAQTAHAADVADVDQDGDIDVLAASFSDNTVAWYENQDGSGGAWVQHDMTAPGSGPIAVTTADVDRDGDLDIIAAVYIGDSVILYKASSPGVFGARQVIATVNNVYSLAAADLDLDGDPDIIAGSDQPLEIRWFENTDGLGTFAAGQVIDASSDTRTIHVADINGDGIPDVVAPDAVQDRVRWYANQGGHFRATFVGTAPATLLETQTSDLFSIQLRHLGGAGDPDIEGSELNIRFEETPGDPLSSIEANELFAQLSIHLDDGSGVFEDGVDASLVDIPTLFLDNGVQTIELPSGAPGLALSPGGDLLLFAVVQLAAGAPAHSPSVFYVSSLPESASARDLAQGASVLRECPDTVYAGPIGVSRSSDPPRDVVTVEVDLTAGGCLPWETVVGNNDCNDDGDDTDMGVCQGTATPCQGNCGSGIPCLGADDRDCNDNAVADIPVWLFSEGEPNGERFLLDCIDATQQDCNGSCVFQGPAPYSAYHDVPGTLFVRRNGTSPAEIRVVSENSPVTELDSDVLNIFHDSIEIEGFRIVDNGDADLFADTSETVELYVTLLNKSGTPLTGVTAHLFTYSPNIDCVLRGIINVGDLPAGVPTEAAEPFEFRVSDIDRPLGVIPPDGPTAAFTVTVQSPPIGFSSRPLGLTLDLDLDVLGGGGPVPFVEGFEGGLGAFAAMPLDENVDSNALSSGLRCQYSDPDPDAVDRSNNPLDPNCYAGFQSPPASPNPFGWHVHDTTHPDKGRAFLGLRSLHFGLHPTTEPADDTTSLSQLDAVVLSQPIALPWDTIQILSFKQQVSFVDYRAAADNAIFAAIPQYETLDRGIVQVQVVDADPLDDDPWETIQPIYNLYDAQGTASWNRCMFDPTDDGSVEDDLFSTRDPFARLGPSSSCYPNHVFANQGNTDHSAAYDPAKIGNASDGAAPQQERGPGTWVETRFSLERYRGQRILIRFVATTGKYYDTVSGADVTDYGSGGLLPAGSPYDDGWYIDDVRITQVLNLSATVHPDQVDNSALPACGTTCDLVDVDVQATPSVVPSSGEVVMLTAAGSLANRCLDGVLQFRYWLDDGDGLFDSQLDQLVRTWSDNPELFTDPVDQDRTFWIEARCSSDPVCDGLFGQFIDMITPGAVTGVTWSKVPGMIDLQYTPACAATDNSVVWGFLGPPPPRIGPYQGRVCGIGNSGTYQGTDPCPPSSSCYYIVVADDGIFEGPYTTRSGRERPPMDPSPCPTLPFNSDLTDRCDP